MMVFSCTSVINHLYASGPDIRKNGEDKRFWKTCGDELISNFSR
jgi:hypothetical protein